MAFIRSSKFRHVFGTPSRKDACYEGFRVTNCAFEGNFIAANSKFIACCVEVGGGGSFIVIPVGQTGRLDVNLAKVSAHREYILDLQWNPFNDSMLATCSEDGTIKLWEVPERGFPTNIDDSKALLVLDYHEKRCHQISWHPIASNIMLSVSQEPKVIVWNLDEGVSEVEIENHPDIIYNAAWSMKGDKIATVCKDKKIRVFAARNGDLIVVNDGHEGSKPSRVIFTFNDKYLFTTGFSRMSERQYACWDTVTLTKLNDAELDTANGCLIPYYDPSTQMVYLAAKGDNVVRYYELVDEAPYFHYITTYQSSVSQRGIAAIPKRSVDVNTNEMMKLYKLIQQKTGIVEPISFTVPRKSDQFQDDLYPDAVSGEPAQESSGWLEGKDVSPNYVSMKEFFKGKTKKLATGGGLKKGGLKGLAAKKKTKEAVKEEEKTEDKPSAPAAAPAQRSVTQTKEPEKPKTTTAAAPAPTGVPGADPKVVKELQNEVKSLKDNEKKMKGEMKSLNDKLKDYDKLTNDLKLLCDAVKKNDERIAALEALVQEESDNEGN